MPTKQSDQEIVAFLTTKLNIQPTAFEYNEEGDLLNLNLSGLALQQLPAEIGQLSNLQELWLYNNQLSQLPAEIWQLSNLQVLRLSGNHLSQVPPEIGQLSNLQELTLDHNRLSQVPAEIGQLTNLQQLSLSSNQLSQVPPEIGQLTNLQRLTLEDNPALLTVPPEIVVQGTADILTFLRELREKSITRYEAKLLVVGEGGTGKSSLLRALRNQTFDATLSTTHGIEIDHLAVSHPHQF